MAHHSFNVEVAMRYGVPCALVLGHIDFLVAKAEKDGVNKYNGKHWVCKSVKKITEQYPYYTENQIRRTVDKLRSNDLILSGHFPTDTTPSTLWYTITQKGKTVLTIGNDDSATEPNQNGNNANSIWQNCQNDSATEPNQNGTSAKSSTKGFSTVLDTVFREKEKKKEAPGVDAGWMEFVREYGSNIGLLPTSTVERGDLEMFFTEFGVDVLREIIHYTARKHPDNPHVYFAKLCRNWLGKGIKTAEQAKAAFKDYERKRDNRRRQDATSDEYAAPEDVFG